MYEAEEMVLQLRVYIPVARHIALHSLVKSKRLILPKEPSSIPSIMSGCSQLLVTLEGPMHSSELHRHSTRRHKPTETYTHII